ncbi:MAG: N-acetyl-anhydromuramyl-L-alanine amidase AmpD [Cyclobacteriaceae bacterium]|jgi:N-acetylmuramoyl-L-alanine amidase
MDINKTEIYMKRHFITIVLFLLLFSCSSDKIIDRPVSFDQERIDLTLEYLERRYNLKQSEPTITPKIVVVHYTVIPTLEKSFAAFEKAKLPDWRPEIIDASALNVSSQFLVDLDGTIYRLMPETRMARHVIGLNHCAIGIENVGGTKEVPLSEAQLEANIWLARYLKKKYGIKYLIGHSEYTNFEGHELWLEVDDGYRTVKSDPGDKFLADIRTATKDLEFLPVPEKH